MYAVVVMVWCPCHARARSLSALLPSARDAAGLLEASAEGDVLAARVRCDGPPISRLSLSIPRMACGHGATRDVTKTDACFPLPGVEGD